jgi:hypothetical protein
LPWSAGTACGRVQQRSRQGHGRDGRGRRARIALLRKASRGSGVRWKEKKEREGEAAGWDRLQREGTN